MPVDIERLVGLLKDGHHLLTGRYLAEELHQQYQAWFDVVQHELERLPDADASKQSLRIGWLGLPSPLFRVAQNFEAAEFDPVDVQRAIEQRCAWLSKTLQLLVAPKEVRDKIAIDDAVKVDRVAAKPRMFIGSSKEGLSHARAMERILYRDAEVTLWSNGPFGLGDSNLEALVRMLDQFDFATLILTPMI